MTTGYFYTPNWSDNEEISAGQSIYGISFEIANIVQRVYFEDFYTIVYFNTEEMYEETIKDCDADEKDYYRFETWGADWEVTSPKSDLFEKVQDYLKQNCQNLLLDCSDYADDLSEEAVAWCKENEMVQTFQEMDQNCHGTEYLDYLAEREMD